MKIVATLANYGEAYHIGGDTQYESVIINIPDENIPPRLKEHLTTPEIAKWQTLSFSLLVEERRGDDG